MLFDILDGRNRRDEIFNLQRSIGERLQCPHVVQHLARLFTRDPIEADYSSERLRECAELEFLQN